MTMQDDLVAWLARPDTHGGVRACIACMHSVDICPVDIMPHMAFKAINAEEIEEALADGSIDLAVHSMKDVPTVLPDG